MKELEEKSIEELKYELETQSPEEDISATTDELDETGELLDNLSTYLRYGSTISPTVAAVIAGAGTGATATISGNDTKGQITLTTGSGSYGTGAQATVTFARNYNSAPIVILTAADADAAVAWDAHDVYVTSTTTTFSINFGVAEAAGVEMVFNYHCLE
jgi:hypothetical protein